MSVLKLIIRILWKKENKFDDEIIRELETISHKILKYIDSTEIVTLMKQMPQIRELDFNSMLWFFEQVIKECFEEDKVSTKLKLYLQKREYMKEDYPIWDFSWALWIALLDIYSLVLLKKLFRVSENKLKWLLYLNMYSWDANVENIISKITYDSIILHGEKLNLDELLKKIVVGSKQSIPEHSFWEPSCPFYATSERNEWIDEVWQFFENKFLPKMQEMFKHKNFIWEKFYSGNLEINKF